MSSPWRAQQVVLMACLGWGVDSENAGRATELSKRQVAHHRDRLSLTSHTLSRSFSIPAFFSVALSHEKPQFNE